VLTSPLVRTLNATPMERLVDPQGRPYFLWDEDVTLDEFKSRLRDPSPEVRAYYLGKLLRQAKPDDVFTFVRAQELADAWSSFERYLGNSREFWRWLLATWERQGHVRRPAH